MNQKLIWQKPEDFVPSVDVVDKKRAALVKSVKQGIASAANADAELKLNLVRDST